MFRLRYVTRFSMQTVILGSTIFVILCCGLEAAPAQSSSVITQGSPDTMIGGKPVGRVGDGTASGAPLVEGSPDVFVNGRPAAIVAGKGQCGGIVVGGSSNVFINGKPVAVAGSSIPECQDPP
jgi:uncharacterized Zn-binding protein involved in type VI secretion